LLIAVFTAVCVAPVDTVVSATVNDAGLRVNFRSYVVFNATETPGASHETLIQLKWIPFDDETHTPHPLELKELYMSPIIARQVLAPPVTLNLIFISQFVIAPRTGKFVKESDGMDGLVMEYRFTNAVVLVVVATPELSEV
jgi:hypothetical protein